MINFFKKIILGDKKKGFVFTTNNIRVRTGNGDLINQPEFGGWTPISSFIVDSSDVGTVGVSTGSNSGVVFTGQTKQEDSRIVVEPKAVFEEIKRESPEISFENLEEKIKVVTERISILKDHLSDEHLKDEHRSVFYLKNRLKYLKTKTKNPLDWAMTTNEAVVDLCKRYKLKVVPLKQYYTLVPNEGIQEMDRYTKAYKAITGDTPIFTLVVKDTEAREQTKKDRDPILLANSPLGNHLFVLGAWDDEILYIDEIIYGGK